VSETSNPTGTETVEPVVERETVERLEEWLAFTWSDPDGSDPSLARAVALAPVA